MDVVPYFLLSCRLVTFTPSTATCSSVMRESNSHTTIHNSTLARVPYHPHNFLLSRSPVLVRLQKLLVLMNALGGKFVGKGENASPLHAGDFVKDPRHCLVK
ncbi:hypothetical protein BDY19DRAFT_110244 [Irpex rosettiformis]|uniref:Uncharacterized protein n=1 Tax=Irpex rosettiformis TaxID=378272 RepID=A0ACB8U5G8_9APHY|nr:hypothetical protein BDY19DRAFT_110244 [Irpex rosettiformis]